MNQTPGEKLRHDVAKGERYACEPYPSPVDSYKLLDKLDHIERNFSSRV